MGHSTSTVHKEDVASIVSAKPFELGMTGRLVLIVFVVVGVLAFATEVAGGNAKHAWMSLHVNFTYWFVIAAAASCFSAVLHICNAQWSRAIARIFQSAMPFFIFSPLVLIVLYFGHHHLFSWSHGPVPGKGVWLTSEFLYIRDILAVFVLIFLARKVVHLTLRRDIGAIRSGLTGLSEEECERWHHKRYNRYVKNWGDDAQKELVETHTLLSRYSPIVVIVYALVVSFIAFDQIMSVDPHWYSTMFGGFYFMSGVYMAMAWCAIAVAFIRKSHPLFLAKVQRKTLHDLGKLLFGFGIFWAYLFWSHYLPIWYGNLPEETGFIIVRLREAPWHGVAWMVLGASFIIPFLLGLSRDLKQIPALLLATGVIAAVGIWLQQYLLFAPTLYPDVLPFNLTDLAIGLGFMGAFLLSASMFLARVPLMPFGDLYCDLYGEGKSTQY